MRLVRCLISSWPSVALVGGLSLLLIALQAHAANGAAAEIGWRDVALLCIGALSALIGAYLKGMEKGVDRRFGDVHDHRVRIETKMEVREQARVEFEKQALRDFQTKAEAAAIIASALTPLSQSIGRVEQSVEAIHRRVDTLQGRDGKS